ncbi:MAG: helix-turn-helix domain-containing protein, partial [Rhodanobacter sp.]
FNIIFQDGMLITFGYQWVLTYIKVRLEESGTIYTFPVPELEWRVEILIGEMEQHTEPPLSTLALAEAIKVTRRQLERLFRLHLNDTPSNFYLGLRLEKARQLLRQSDMSVLEVSLACGFESPSYFTRSYRARFAKCPREDRRREVV